MRQMPGTGEWRATFDDDGMAEAVAFYTKLIQGPWVNPRTGKTEHGVAYYEKDLFLKWDRGEIGMQFGYLADEMLMGYSLEGASAMNPDELSFAPVPTSPIGIQASELNCQMMGLFGGTRDKRVRDAAWRHMRFYNGPEARRIRARVYVENGYGNMILPEKLQAYGLSEYGRHFPPLWEEAYRTCFLNGVPEPYGPGCQLIYHYMSRPFERALSDRIGEIPDRETRLNLLRVINSEVVREANIKMIGIVPEQEMRTRRLVATVLATFIFVAFVLLFVHIWRLFTPPPAPTIARAAGFPSNRTLAAAAFRKYRIAYFLLAPAVLGILLFSYVPLVRGTVIAFQNYKVMGRSSFVGIDNFANVIHDPLFWLSMWRAVEYSLLYLALVFLPPIFLAMILSEIPMGKVFFRVVFYLPAVTAGIVTLLMWKVFFDPSAAGVANRFIGFLGIPAQGWLQDKTTAMLAVMIPQAWASLGPGCLIYLAALKTVPEDLYEAAAIDGATEWQKFWLVAMSLSKPILAVIALGAFIGAYSNFMMAFILCQDEHMWTLMVWLFKLESFASQGVIFASVLVAAVPTLLMFMLCQNVIIRGIVVPTEK